MIFKVTRCAAGLLGALFVFIAFGLWFNIESAAAKLGLPNLTLAGKALVRADVAGFFLVGGGLTLFSAIKGNKSYLWPVILLVGTAFMGRALTLILNGSEAASFPPMIIEAVMVALLYYCQRTWPAAPPSKVG
jgi:hypothetical protein